MQSVKVCFVLWNAFFCSGRFGTYGPGKLLVKRTWKKEDAGYVIYLVNNQFYSRNSHLKRTCCKNIWSKNIQMKLNFSTKLQKLKLTLFLSHLQPLIPQSNALSDNCSVSSSRKKKLEQVWSIQGLNHICQRLKTSADLRSICCPSV